ncbi:MAG: DegV family protein [Actinomycetota bacterium]|nr:MAG: DegV family [Actinomycetota bacterium]MDO8949199.1 DegV family protein [Actinomycetota bacterium]MDP3629593.1 DegV family protein [Actinomycetota bacterium]
MSVSIVTDSTSYLPQEDREKYNITVVPLSVILDGVTYVEGTPFAEGFFAALAASKAFPTSSQPSISDFVDAFTAPVARGDEVVGVFLSSEMSGTYSTALLARDMVLAEHPGAVIEIVDSRSNCMELGYAVLAAAEAVAGGADAAGAADAAKRMVARTRFLFVPDTLEYLRRGGRMGGAQALLGTLLQIRPILTVADGRTQVFAKVRTKRKALTEMVAAFSRDIEAKGFGGVAVHHIVDEAEGAELAALVEAVVSVPVRIIPIGPTIGMHVGPGTAALVYHTLEEMNKSSVGSGQ